MFAWQCSENLFDGGRSSARPVRLPNNKERDCTESTVPFTSPTTVPDTSMGIPLERIPLTPSIAVAAQTPAVSLKLDVLHTRSRLHRLNPGFAKAAKADAHRLQAP